MAEASILFEVNDQIGTLTLNRPDARNAFSREMVDRFEEALYRVKADRNCRALIITGGDSAAFCAGADLKERKTMEQTEVERFLYRINSLFNMLEDLPIPTVAAINGFAFGGGLEMALCCDFRIAAATAQLGLTETGLGIIPGAGGTQRLPRLIGPSRAKRLIYSAARIDAARALELGVVDQVSDDLPATGREFCLPFMAAAPIALAQAKFAIQQGLEVGLASGLAIEQKAYQVTLPTEDRMEALKAFQEKRKPVFKGR